MGATPLHHSLFELCRNRIVADPEFLSFKNWTAVPEIDPEIFEEYRFFRLRRTLRYVAEHSRHYRSLFEASGTVPDAIRTMDNIAALPLTDARHVASDPFAFLCVSQGMVERAVTFTSSGTIGPQKRVFFTWTDIEAITDYMAAGMKTVADSSEVVQILLPGGQPFSQSDLLARGVRKMGARSVFTGMFVPAEQQIASVRENGSTVLFSETHLLYRLTKLIEEKHSLKGLGVRTLFLSTSYASPVMIDYLREAWNATVSTHYGLTEMGLGLAVDCPLCGIRHFNELDVFAEVIDPATEEPLPLGSVGELVFTSIQREAMPLIRYRTGDMAYLGKASNRCDSPLRTIGQVPYRVESIVPIRHGIFIHPTLFHEVLFGIPSVIDYEISLKNLEGLESLSFDVEVARPDEASRQRVTDALRDAPCLKGLKPSELGIEVHFKAAGELRQGSHFKKVVKDLRNDPKGLL
jgi:phenylacetate-CoA ligase